MIDHVENAESSWFEHKDDREWDPDNDTMYIVADDQCWDSATLKQLREEFNIVFMSKGDAVMPVMILGKDSNHPRLVIGHEDDGTIFFTRRFGQFEHSFSPYWVKSLIADLREALKLSGLTGKNNTRS
jgi:hypothetical protein